MAALRRRSFLKWAGLGASALLAPTLRRRAGGAEPATLPIKRVVVILRENHSYDNYFGTFPQGNGQTAGGRCEDERPDPPHLREHALRSEEHTSELQSPCNLVCRLLLEKKKKTTHIHH